MDFCTVNTKYLAPSNDGAAQLIAIVNKFAIWKLRIFVSTTCEW